MYMLGLKLSHVLCNTPKMHFVDMFKYELSEFVFFYHKSEIHIFLWPKRLVIVRGCFLGHLHGWNKSSEVKKNFVNKIKKIL